MPSEKSEHKSGFEDLSKDMLLEVQKGTRVKYDVYSDILLMVSIYATTYWLLKEHPQTDPSLKWKCGSLTIIMRSLASEGPLHRRARLCSWHYSPFIVTLVGYNLASIRAALERSMTVIMRSRSHGCAWQINHAFTKGEVIAGSMFGFSWNNQDFAT